MSDLADTSDLGSVLMTMALLSGSPHKTDTVPTTRAFLSDLAMKIKEQPEPFLRALGGEPWLNGWWRVPMSADS